MFLQGEIVSFAYNEECIVVPATNDEELDLLSCISKLIE